MKLLLLTKRHYMAKDIILEEYGRQYELACCLAGAGWEVRAYCLDYHSIGGKTVIHSGGVAWYSYPALLFWQAWRRDVRHALQQWQPDVVLGCSDAVHISAAVRAAQLNGIGAAIDLHDNLESFGLTRVPGIHKRFARAVENTNLIFCVSEPLRDKIESDFDIKGKLQLLENALPDAFGKYALEKSASRRRHGIPVDARVIGLAGALTRHRGMDGIISGFELLKREHSDLVLALAGPTDRTGRRFDQDGILYLGKLDYDSIPSFLRTLDVGIVPNVRPAFADYCYPQKAVEMCALGVPVVAANIGVMKTLAAGHEEILYTPGDPVDFARAVGRQLEKQVVLDAPMHTWAEQGEKVNRALVELVK